MRVDMRVDMRVLDPGHSYALKDNKALTESCMMVFFKDPDINKNGYSGTTNQEVLRVLIDRVQFLENQKHSEMNKEIIYHLRMALVLHEERHLERLVEKEFPVEELPVGKTGHLV